MTQPVRRSRRDTDKDRELLRRLREGLQQIKRRLIDIEARVLSGPRSWDHGSPKLRCDRACPCPSNQAASCCCFCACCGYVGNAFALSKRSGISTVLVASILSLPARHAAMGNWLFIA